MGWLDRNLHWILLTLFVVTTLALVGLVGVGTLALLAGVLAGATLATLLADATALLGIGMALLVADVVLAVALVVTVVRRASLPKSDHLASTFALVERVVPPLRGLALSKRFEPTVEDRERALKRRYVEGKLSEVAFEREMRDLLDDAERSPVDTGSYVPRSDQSESHAPPGERVVDSRCDRERERE